VNSILGGGHDSWGLLYCSIPCNIDKHNARCACNMVCVNIADILNTSTYILRDRNVLLSCYHYELVVKQPANIKKL